MRLGVYGFGSIGRIIAREALRRGHELIAVIDRDEKLIGRCLSEFLGEWAPELEISDDPSSLNGTDLVIHATTSYLDKAFPQLEEIISMKAHVVSTCETLAYPHYRYPDLASKINGLAKANKVSVIGCGINPGLLLDTLVVVIASSSNLIERIKAVRSLNAAKRRKPFQRKIGLGMKVEDVRSLMAQGKLTGHIGYAESVCLIAKAGDLTLSKVVEAQEPIEAEEDVKIGDLLIRRGEVLGIKGQGIGYLDENQVIKVELHAYIGAPEYEEIMIEGADYSLRWRSSGTPGDLGTAAVILNVAEKLPSLNPGLHLISDLLPFKLRFKQPSPKD